MTVSPQFGRLFARNELDGARSVYKTATMWTMTFAWPLYIITGAAVGLVIPIFGADYTAGAKVTVILSAAMLVATACGGVDAVLLMSGRSWLSLGNAVITLALNVGLDLLLIPKYGILGAAIGHATSLALRNLLALYQINRLMHMWAFTNQSLKIAGISLGCFGVLPAILHIVSAPELTIVAAILLGMVAYTRWAWRSRTSLQLDTFGNALRRRARGPTSP
jgi:O-antigen/teichoic acid export membrane protein